VNLKVEVNTVESSFGRHLPAQTLAGDAGVDLAKAQPWELDKPRVGTAPRQGAWS